MKYLTLILCLTFPLVAGGQEQKKASPDDPKAVKPVLADNLAEAYRTNEAFADDEFTGRKFEVLGTIAVIFKAAEGEGVGYRLILKADPAISFRFTAKDRRSLAVVRAGETVIVRGKCGGLSLVEVARGKTGEGIGFTDCELVPFPKQE